MELTKAYLDRVFSSPLGQQLDVVYIVQGPTSLTPFVREEEAERFRDLMKIKTEIIEVHKETYQDEYK